MLGVFEQMLQRQLFGDAELPRTGKLVYLGMRAHRRTTVKGYVRALGMPETTIRTSLKLLQAHDWVYSFRDGQTREKSFVPWMPLDVERMLAATVARLFDIVTNRGEWLMKRLLDIIVNNEKYVDNACMRWAAVGSGEGPLEFDCLFEEAKVAIEFQGRQHYEEVTFRDGRSNLPRQHARDGIKALACQRRQFAFVEVPDIELSYETLVTKLDGLLPLLPPRMDRPLFQTLADLCHSYASWAKDQRGKN